METVFISAAEPSADVHGASLIRAVRGLRPTVRFVGVAGPRMAAAGCETIFDMTSHAAMLLGALRAAGRAGDMLTACYRRLHEERFHAAVVIDSPTLHLPLAAIAKEAGVPVMYYIAPQLWAWGARRIEKIRRRVDRLAVILPFEESYFRQRGVDAVYVGHPLADAVAAESIDPREVQTIRTGGQPFVAILPGSRKHVVRQVLPGQLEVAERIREQFSGAAFGVSVAGENLSPIIESLVARCRANVRLFPGTPGALIEAADLVLVASGTSTLEVALHHRPMIVMYNSSRLFHHLVGKWMIQTPYLCLPNILAGRAIVPEFMPYYTSTRPIADCAIRLLSEAEKRNQMVADLEKAITASPDRRIGTSSAGTSRSY